MNAHDARLSLLNMGIVVTRPAHQADHLCQLIEAHGGNPIRFPTVRILAPHDPAAMLTIIGALADYDIAIFSSANAVTCAMPRIKARGGIPNQVRVAAIGKGTMRALRQFDVDIDVVPDGPYDSEALLAMAPMLNVDSQRIVIFRGEGGRELICETLKDRGALVTYAEVYRRGIPNSDPGRLVQRWSEGEIHAVVATSNEILRNLFDIVGEIGQHWLRDTPLVVVSSRACQLARELGFSGPPSVAREASDEAIVGELLTLARTLNSVTSEDPQ